MFPRLALILARYHRHHVYVPEKYTSCNKLLGTKEFATCSSMKQISKDTVEEDEKEFTKMRIQSGIQEWTRDAKHVLVVHPKIRWGAESERDEEVALKLDEACALVHTLPGFTVAGSTVIGTDYNTKKKLIWGQGRVEQVKSLQQQHNASAIMMNVDILTPLQQASLHEELRVPIYDRYTLVLQIFKFFAQTKEALLQISLAEIPYIRQRLYYSDKHGAPTNSLNIGAVNSSLSSSKGDKFEILRLREHTLRKKIRAAVEEKTNEVELKKMREKRSARKALLVAVIGYTNAGKTTLIKALTGASHISGENRLFATLDTTIHPALLPSRNRIYIADTIGFISDLPVSLIASFEATLRHVMNADLLIHIQDVSHPNLVNQQKNVMDTLRGLNIPNSILDTMISVGNKIDRLPLNEIRALKEQNPNMIMVSCRKSVGLPVLTEKIDHEVQRITGSKPRRFRLKPGSQLASYLYAEGYVSEEPEVDSEGNLLFKVQMTDEQIQCLQAYLKGSGKKIRKYEAEM